MRNISFTASVTCRLLFIFAHKHLRTLAESCGLSGNMVLQSLVHPIRTLEELNKQRKQNLFTDITILVSDEKFPAHRALLAAHSSLFRSVLQESVVIVDNAPNINLDGVDAAYFSILLDFIYTSKLCVNLENVEQVSATSEFLQITSVVELCEKFKLANMEKKEIPEESYSSNHEYYSEESCPQPTPILPKDNGGNSCITDEKTQIEIELSENGVALSPTTKDAEVLQVDYREKDKRGRKSMTKYKCPLCNKHMTQHKLEAHMRTHTGEKTARCSYCNRSFANIYNLRIHERTHTGERPYKCTQCDKSFADPSTLCKHKLWHAGIKKKKCPLCAKPFSTTAQVNEHMKTHTKEKPFKCPHCTKSFAYKCDYKRHLRNHTGDLFGPCIYCGRYFNHGGNYKVHLRNHEKKMDKVQHGMESSKAKVDGEDESILKVDDLAQLMSEGHSIEVMIDGKLLVKPATSGQTSEGAHPIVMSQNDELVSAAVTLQQSMAQHDRLIASHCEVIKNDCDDALVIADQTTGQNF